MAGWRAVSEGTLKDFFDACHVSRDLKLHINALRSVILSKSIL